MLDMPVIPGLGSASSEPLSLTELLDSLDDQTVADLVSAIGQPMEELPEEEMLEEELPKEELPEEELPEEELPEEELPEEELPEAPEGEGGGEIEELQIQVEDAVARGQEELAELEGLVDLASENEEVGGDPKETEKALEEAERLVSDMTDHAEAFVDAVEEQDLEKAATSGMQVLECEQKIAGLLVQARASANANSSAEEPTAEKPAPAIGVWADNYLR